MTKTISLLFFILSLISCKNNKSMSVSQQQIKDSLTAELNEVYKEGQFNGFSVAVVNENGTVYQHGIGFANAADKKGYTENTIQNIGSVSKTLVGIALLKAQETGKLNLDDPISKYLPFKVSNPFFPDAKITVRQLANHTSSITDNDIYLKKSYVLKPDQDLTKVKTFIEDEEILNSADSNMMLEKFLEDYLSEKGKLFSKESFIKQKPGEIFEYSNIGTALAAYIIERATGKRFNEYTKENILVPLKMNASGWEFDEINFNNYSTLYASSDSAVGFYSLITYPDGNFITSADDLAKFLSELIKGYEGHGTVLNNNSYKELFSPKLSAVNFIERNDKNPYSESYNYSVFMGFSVAGNIGHTGGDPGVSSIMFLDPKTKIGRLLIVNTNINDKAGNDEFYRIFDLLGKYSQKLSLVGK